MSRLASTSAAKISAIKSLTLAIIGVSSAKLATAAALLAKKVFTFSNMFKKSFCGVVISICFLC